MTLEDYRLELEYQLNDNVMPFWIERTVDREYGGCLHHLDRDGSVISPNKGMWVHGRFLWLLSWLCRTRGGDDDFLVTSRRVFDFIRSHARDSDGRWWYELTRDGRPRRKRRYFFTEVFIALGLSSWAAADPGEESRAAAETARRDLARLLDHRDTLPPKYAAGLTRMRSHADVMILINLYQEFRGASGSRKEQREWSAEIDLLIDELFRFFVKDSEGVLLENTGPDGEIIDTPEGREVNPGHAVETAWFLLDEARFRGDKALARSGTSSVQAPDEARFRGDEALARSGTSSAQAPDEARFRGDKALMSRALGILSDALERGWDEEYGGIRAFTDLRGRSSLRIEARMKYWWPHTEAMYAALAAFALTGDPLWRRWFSRITDYTLAAFPDPEGPEWFGYLFPDGSLANAVKGNLWKGPFHIPRALAKCSSLLGEMAAKGLN